MSEPLVIIEGITKCFAGMNTPAIDALSAQIFPGKLTGLVGPDGAGKSTLLRLIVGLLRADTGAISVAGFDAANEAETIHEITGYMPQKFGLYEDLSVIENLELYAALRNITGKKRDDKFLQLLAFTDLERFSSRLAGKLSGGMKQKLGLACAMIGTPKLLLLDEPTVGIDPVSRRELWVMVKELLARGIAIIWSTAYLDEADRCDSVILLNEGKKLYDGHPHDIVKNVIGRTWHIRGIEEHNKRSVLIEMLKKKNVIDGIIQGKNIRIVMGKNCDPPKISQGVWHPITPRFEDAFIDILGGGPGGYSALAEETAEKQKNGHAVIDAHGLTKNFGNFTAVKNSSFNIKRGEIFGLLGPNGAGKSTTFKMLCGLTTITEGSAFINGLDLKAVTSKARSLMGYMAQNFSLYGSLTVFQNLTFFSGIYGLSGRYQKHQIDLMTEIFDFKEYLAMNAEDLPLGFQKRLALACAVMHQPDILFLDEPTSGVDPITRREFWNHINGMVERGVTVMVTTHFMDEAEYCDRISLMYRSESIATGTPDELKSSVISVDMPNPTLEDAFIALIERSEKERIHEETL